MLNSFSPVKMFFILLITVIIIAIVPMHNRSKYRRKVIICTVVLVGIILAGFIPVKFAVDDADLQSIEKYHIVKWTQVTGASFIIIGDENGYYEQGIYIEVEEDTPFIADDYELLSGDNCYIVKGEIIGDANNDDTYIYEAAEWNIKYPVKRNSIIPLLPKSYVCLFDLVF